MLIFKNYIIDIIMFKHNNTYNSSKEINTKDIVIFTVTGLSTLISFIFIIIFCISKPRFTEKELEILKKEKEDKEEDKEEDKDDELLTY